jgi:hypothetical protein
MRNFRLPLSALLFLFSTNAPGQSRRLDTTTFVVLGEGLAAGMANYGLSREVQEWSFPAQMAGQMKTAFPQPLIQSPGLLGMFGLPVPLARIPTYPQTTVRVFPVNPDKKPGESDKPPLFVFNLSVPGFRVADSLSRKPKWPLVQSYDPQQTTVNLLLGAPALLLENEVPLWTQLEYAQAMNPTLALIELGFFEALDAASNGNPEAVPSAAGFQENYAAIVKTLRALYAEVIAATIPDPFATAYFSSVDTVARLTQTSSTVLASGYGVQAGDLITRPGLYAIGNRLLGAQDPFPANSIVRAATIAQVRSRIAALNSAISAVARDNQAVVYDLNAFYTVLRASGMDAGGRHFTADYLGGFYSLDGVYPSIAGHALIANDILRFLNSTYGKAFPLVDLAPILRDDPAMSHGVAQ